MDELARLIREAFITFDIRPRESLSEIYVTEAVWCLRKAFFNLRFNANPIVTSPDAIVGKLLHLSLPKVLKDVLGSAEYEVPCSHPLKEGFVLKGRADAVTEYRVFEFKFSSPYSEAIPFYCAQANAYAVMLEKIGWSLVTIDKRTFDVKVLEADIDKTGFQSVVKRAETVIDCLKEDRVPPGPEFNWECNNCPYNIICVRWKEWMGQKPLKQ